MQIAYAALPASSTDDIQSESEVIDTTLPESGTDYHAIIKPISKKALVMFYAMCAVTTLVMGTNFVLGIQSVRHERIDIEALPRPPVVPNVLLG